ncbi:hypothetical protein PMAYCL1PPCAC_10890, partial [Pristionchus mayeri]
RVRRSRKNPPQEEEMPEVSESPGPSSATSRVAARGRKRAKKGRKPPAAPQQNKESPVCSICGDDLSTMRITKTKCKHIFHRTCLLRWLETRKRPLEQNCPYCRAHVNYIKDGNRHLKITEACGKPAAAISLVAAVSGEKYLYQYK